MRPDEGPVGQAEDEQKIGFSKSPHPPLTWSPLSQLGEGFECFAFLIWDFSFSMREPVAEEAG